MKKWTGVILAGAMSIAALTACGSTTQNTSASSTTETAAEENVAEITANENFLAIAKQGIFSSGGTVTEPVTGEFDETQNWLDFSRSGNTAHVDHANVFYQIPAEETSSPMVFLHGYGQSRMGWMMTPDGRDGWSTSF